MNNGLSWVWCLKAIFITILTAIPLVIYIVNSKTSGGQYQVYGSTHAQCIESDDGITSEVTKRRNELSRQLNDMSKKLGQKECESQHVNKNGGWCKHLSLEATGEHKTDFKLVKGLSRFLEGKNVGSFGDGPGVYKREILKLGQVKSYDAYDGAPFCEETSEGRVQYMDLTIAQYGIPLYDWIVSLEVAEHIPQQYESVYLDNIFRHAREGIIFSWAVPGQGGMSHINNKPTSYVVNLMRNNGFVKDDELSILLRKSTSLWWLQQNTNVYKRVDFQKFKNETYMSQFYT
ncbi:uncharacterized protein [Mytilus edulis]|uniref:uncharacterized protein n=1 Tax=Mytilus edulis TaxID=6550 RepID=UPI0039F056C7